MMIMMMILYRSKRWSSSTSSRIRLSSLSQTKAHSYRFLADPTRPTRGSFWQQPVRRRTRTQGSCRQPQPHRNTGIFDAMAFQCDRFFSDFALRYTWRPCTDFFVSYPLATWTLYCKKWTFLSNESRYSVLHEGVKDRDRKILTEKCCCFFFF